MLKGRISLRPGLRPLSPIDLFSFMPTPLIE
jgi:hypothetical protein